MVGCSMPGEASMASSGLIAPITGRRYVKAWRIDEFVPVALDFYRWSESILDQQYFFPIEIVRHLSHPEGQVAWMKRLEDPEYTKYIAQSRDLERDAGGRPFGILTGGYRLDTPGWLLATRQFLISKGFLDVQQQPHHPDEPDQGVKIFATGAVDPLLNLRIIPNKGESLLVRMPDWPYDRIIKEDVFIIPIGKDHLYWIGSYYEPWPISKEISDAGKQRLLDPVQRVYSGHIEILDHMAGVRPTVNDRRPLIGPMPGRTDAYLFNGMGTKGTSLAPFWAVKLIDHIVSGTSLSAEVMPDRYIPPYNAGKGAGIPITG